MVKTLLSQVKEYKKASILTPAVMLVEDADTVLTVTPEKTWRPSS